MKTSGQKTNNKLMSTKLGHAYKRYHARKTHAKKFGVPFDITLEYVQSLIVDVCPVLGVPLSWCVQSGKVTENSPTLDKIDPNKGYIKGNVQWISNRANRIKNDGTAEEHKLIAKWMDSFTVDN